MQSTQNEVEGGMRKITARRETKSFLKKSEKVCLRARLRKRKGRKRRIHIFLKAHDAEGAKSNMTEKEMLFVLKVDCQFCGMCVRVRMRVRECIYIPDICVCT